MKDEVTAEDEFIVLRRGLCKAGRHEWGRGEMGRKCLHCEVTTKDYANADA